MYWWKCLASNKEVQGSFNKEVKRSFNKEENLSIYLSIYEGYLIDKGISKAKYIFFRIFSMNVNSALFGIGL